MDDPKNYTPERFNYLFFGGLYWEQSKAVNVVGIDPGTYESAAVKIRFNNLSCEISDLIYADNTAVLEKLKDMTHDCDLVTIEMISSRGAPVGKSVFLTCLWIGRFMEHVANLQSIHFLSRPEVNYLMCGRRTVSDSIIRNKLINTYAEKFNDTQRLRDIKYDLWLALAAAHASVMIPPKEYKNHSYVYMLQR